jgi:bifunctional lysine-specific demethylase and histidyl-hydroxylase NO66
VSVDAPTFAERHWSRTPLLSRAAELPGPFEDLLSRDDVDELVGERALREPFFQVVREGGRLPSPVRTVGAGGRRIGDVVDADRLAQQHAEGATLVLNALHRTHPPLVRFCRALAAELGHATQCNAYVTPGGDAQGFAFHHDTHDVFVLQVSGRKRWTVHEPVLPLPLPSQARSGADLVPAGASPLLDVELGAGDALYLPRGYVHAASTTDEHSVHLTVGVLSTTWYDVLSDALTLAAGEADLRDALPVHPREELAQALPAFLRRAADWLAALPPEQLRDVVDRRLARAVPAEPLRLLAQAGAVAGLTGSTPLRPRAGLSATVDDVDGHVVLGLPDRTVSLPVSTGPALRRLLAGPATPGAVVDEHLDAADVLVLVRRLLREGVVVPA